MKITKTKLRQLVLEQTKKKLSKALMGNTINLGRQHTDSAKEKMSVSNTGKKYPNRKSPPPMSKETRQKISDVQRGKKKSCRNV